MATPNDPNKAVKEEVKETAQYLENTLKSLSENIRNIFDIVRGNILTNYPNLW